MSVKEWVKKTNAIGIMSKAGRYGGTYAHKDIAFEFGMWISPKFKLLLIKEFEDFCKQGTEKQFDENKHLKEQTRFIYDKLKKLL